MKKIARYDFTLKPKKPNALLMGVAKKIAAYPVLKARDFECEYVNMDGIEPPYFLLANHASEMDFRILFGSIRPYNMNFVVAIDAMHDNGIGIMRLAGGICKRKFVQDLLLIKNMKYCATHYKNPICIYPEARYSFDGTPSYVTPAVGKMAKLLKIPVVLMMSYGNYICNPQWNKDKFRSTPLKGKLVCVATAEEVKTLSADQINERIAKNFVYDDFKYQYDNNIKIDFPQRARGLNRILYQCCECGTEFEMYGEGTTLECKKCGKKWEMTELGRLKALDGKTRFEHIPDWFRWERENVKREVENGTYSFEDEIEVHTLPKNKYYYQGTGKFKQDMTGTHFWCEAYGKKFELHLAPNELESVHIEFGYRDIKKKQTFGDCLDISTLDDSFWLHPINSKDVIMKISFATEELYQLAHKKLHEAKQIEAKQNDNKQVENSQTQNAPNDNK
jgi:hypothetical protein